MYREEEMAKAIEYFNSVGYLRVKGEIKEGNIIYIDADCHKERLGTAFLFQNIVGNWVVTCKFWNNDNQIVKEGKSLNGIVELHTLAMAISKCINNTSFYYETVKGSDNYWVERFDDEGVSDRIRRVLEGKNGFPINVRVTTYKGMVIIESTEEASPFPNREKEV